MFDIIYPKAILAAAEGGGGNSDCAIATVVVDCWSYHWILQPLPLPLTLLLEVVVVVVVIVVVVVVVVSNGMINNQLHCSLFYIFIAGQAQHKLKLHLRYRLLLLYLWDKYLIFIRNNIL